MEKNLLEQEEPKTNSIHIQYDAESGNWTWATLTSHHVTISAPLQGPVVQNPIKLILG